MPIEIDEIRITAMISEQEAQKQDPAVTESANVEAIISLAVEAVLERLRELKED